MYRFYTITISVVDVVQQKSKSNRLLFRNQLYLYQWKIGDENEERRERSFCMQTNK